MNHISYLFWRRFLVTGEKWAFYGFCVFCYLYMNLWIALLAGLVEIPQIVIRYLVVGSLEDTFQIHCQDPSTNQLMRRKTISS